MKKIALELFLDDRLQSVLVALITLCRGSMYSEKRAMVNNVLSHPGLLSHYTRNPAFFFLSLISYLWAV